MNTLMRRANHSVIYEWIEESIKKRFLSLNFNLDYMLLIKECFFTAKVCCAWSFKPTATGKQNVERVAMSESVKDGAKTSSAKLPLSPLPWYRSLHWSGKYMAKIDLHVCAWQLSNRPARAEYQFYGWSRYGSFASLPPAYRLASGVMSAHFERSSSRKLKRGRGAGVDAEYPTSLLGMPLIFPSNVFFYLNFSPVSRKSPTGPRQFINYSSK